MKLLLASCHILYTLLIVGSPCMDEILIFVLKSWKFGHRTLPSSFYDLMKFSKKKNVENLDVYILPSNVYIFLISLSLCPCVDIYPLRHVWKFVLLQPFDKSSKKFDLLSPMLWHVFKLQELVSPQKVRGRSLPANYLSKACVWPPCKAFLWILFFVMTWSNTNKLFCGSIDLRLFGWSIDLRLFCWPIDLRFGMHQLTTWECFPNNFDEERKII